MRETWLRGNRRAALPLGVAPLVLVAAGAALMIAGSSWTWRAAGGVVLVVAALLLWQAAWLTLGPRLSRDDDCLMVRMRPGRPVRVPLELVECFFFGTGGTMFPGTDPAERPTANVVVRLAERATSLARVDVHPLVGRWCDGYITIRGTWCEPLSKETLERLNARLSRAQAELRTRGRA